MQIINDIWYNNIFPFMSVTQIILLHDVNNQLRLLVKEWMSEHSEIIIETWRVLIEAFNFIEFQNKMKDMCKNLIEERFNNLYKDYREIKKQLMDKKNECDLLHFELNKF